MDHEYFLIERFDHYYESVNNKANVFLGINVFSLTGLTAALTTAPNYLSNCNWAYVWLFCMLTSNLFSTLFTLRAVIPYGKSCGSSLVYFGDIAGFTQQDFVRRYTNCDDPSKKVDLCNQIHFLATGIAKKFRRLRYAGIAFFVEALLIAPLTITVVNNLK